jgi:hypothetical protein
VRWLGSRGLFRSTFVWSSNIGEQHLKKCCVDRLVLGCFFGLAFAASAGHGCKSTGKYGHVPGGTGTYRKEKIQKSAAKH